MPKTESTAINNLIELTATATPLKPAPGEDLMFAEPAKRSTKSVSVPRMSATLTNAAPVQPLPRGRGAAGTQQNALTPPGVRITTAPPSRAVTIPPMPPLPPAPRTSRPSLPPPTRQSAPIAAQAVVAPTIAPPPPTDPSYDSAPLAPIDLTDQSWFEESRAVDRVTGPVSESTWVGTVQVPKQATTVQWLKRLALPMGAMIVVGIFVGGYVAFGGEGGHQRGPIATAAEPAAVTPATADLAKTEPTKIAPADGEAAVAGASEPANVAAATGDVAQTEPATATAEPATAPAKAEPAVAVPNLAAAAVPAAAVPAVAAPVITNGKTVFVDVRLDSKPSGATVMLVDRGKTMFLGTTPISTALDPSRQYDVVFTYKDRPTVLEHLDPRTQSKLAVTLSHAASKSVAAPITEVAKPVKVEAAKVEAAKVEAPNVEKPAKVEPAKAIAKEAPKAEAPKAEAPKAEVAKEVPKAETPKAGGQGVLMVSSKPPCEIYVDGKATGLMTPQRSLSLSAGAHKITLINSAEKIKKTLTIQITADQPTKLIQDLMAK